MQRFFLALHATTPAALVVAVFVHLWGPSGMPSLAQRPVWATWVLIGAWLLMSGMAAWALRTLALWRVALGGAGAMLAIAGVVGLALGSAHAVGMCASLLAVGLAFAGIAAFIGPRRVQAHRRKAARHATVATSGPAAHPVAPRSRWHPRGWGRLVVPAHLPFWLSGLLAVESFRLAHIVATEPARSSGMLGLLLAFFIALPAATLRHWAPRTTVLLWAVAALAYGGLAAKAGLVQWAVACALCAVAAGAPLLLRAHRALRWRRTGNNAPHPPAPAADPHPPEAA
ncbi:hypothetical protein ASF11_09380 [Acidovorax sp. Leaf76]|uniref:hypothetical protein n=1 Tax=unclassified Acidovorax TaxID=2684926 RepID=UPI0006FF9C15|nr:MULTISPECIES: hypothetical protein [unclassified Acidovorax]KQO16382.1 hypothetical protein ASF11_09380 [Acidovorax sp. Leaf76]KQO32448.1 hypothetical protein ASF19_08210 [Acidovorax sp. Leaf84]KQS32016.1 hypothetical protein ASG27_08500 [Acidovorax sp. Leaf191]